jgi:hypothetical protein
MLIPIEVMNGSATPRVTSFRCSGGSACSSATDAATTFDVGGVPQRTNRRLDNPIHLGRRPGPFDQRRFYRSDDRSAPSVCSWPKAAPVSAASEF